MKSCTSLQLEISKALILILIFHLCPLNDVFARSPCATSAPFLDYHRIPSLDSTLQKAAFASPDCFGMHRQYRLHSQFRRPLTSTRFSELHHQRKTLLTTTKPFLPSVAAAPAAPHVHDRPPAVIFMVFEILGILFVVLNVIGIACLLKWERTIL